MIYFDSAATTYLKPQSVFRAMADYMRYNGGNPGRGGHELSIRASNSVYACREAISEYIGAEPDEIVLTPSATFALNLAIKGMLCAFDHAIISDDAHNSMLRPLNSTCSFSYCSSPDDAALKIRKNTKMLLVNHASNVTGAVCDLEGYIRLAKNEKILLLVDASQSLGHIPFNVNGIDFVAAPGHKGLFGPQGTGFLYVRKGLFPKPLTEGGTGFHSESLTQPELIPEGLESGTLNGVGFAGLCAGIEFVKNLKHEENKLTKMLKEELLKIPHVTAYLPESEKTVPVISFNIKECDCVHVADVLSEKFKICVRSGLHCAPLAHKKIGTENTGTVRVSLCAFNTVGEVEKFLNIVDRRSTFVVK